MDAGAQELYGLFQAEAERGTLFIVEGEKDRRALRLLGIECVVTTQAKPLYKIIEDVSDVTKEAIILTDFDREGRMLYSRLSSGLSRHGVRINNTIRHFLLRNTTLSHIEGLDTYLQKRMTQLL